MGVSVEGAHRGCECGGVRVVCVWGGQGIREGVCGRMLAGRISKAHRPGVEARSIDPGA